MDYHSSTILSIEAENNDSSAMPWYDPSYPEELSLSENTFQLNDTNVTEDPPTPLDQTLEDDIDKVLAQQSIDGSFDEFHNILYDDNMDGFNLLSHLSQVPSSTIVPNSFTVAPAMVEIQNKTLSFGAGNIVAVDINRTAPLPLANGRRKSDRAPVRPSAAAVKIEPNTEPVLVQSVDVKPNQTMLILESQIQGTSRGQKRSQPVPSPAPSGSKRIKKYELDDIENPSVRNARAAKANREKKKQQVVDLQEEVVKWKTAYEQEVTEKSRLAEENRKLKAENRKLIQHQHSVNGIVQVQNDLNKYLGTVLPALGQTGYPVQRIMLAPGFVSPAPGTRSITIQHNLDHQTMTVSCPVVPANPMWNGGNGMPIPPQ